MQLQERLSEWIDEDIVIDCTSPFVAIGRLTKVGQDFVELHQADMHDLRDSSTSRRPIWSKPHGMASRKRAK